MENEYEEPLQRVQYRERVRDSDGLLVQVQEAEGPRQAQQEGQDQGTVQPDPGNWEFIILMWCYVKF